jgi:hypothetical protein
VAYNGLIVVDLSFLRCGKQAEGNEISGLQHSFYRPLPPNADGGPPQLPDQGQKLQVAGIAGWGGVQRWATARMAAVEGWHLDIACGYATFLAQYAPFSPVRMILARKEEAKP